MNRPWLLRIAPLRLRAALYHRLYRPRREKWTGLYRNASLHFAPGVRMNLWPGDEGHSAIAFTGLYELGLSRRLANHARHGGRMVDAGANYGYFSLLWAAASRRNRVTAFEASPRNHDALKGNVALNGLDSRIEVHTAALGDMPGTRFFSLGAQGQTGWGGFADLASEARVEVPVVTLDGSLSQEARVEVLKIDVEGADTWVLYGAERLLQRKQINHVYFEQNRERMRRLGIREGEALEFLRKVGYPVRPLNDPASALVEYYATSEP